jgi:Flp pilus assembly protein TadD
LYLATRPPPPFAFDIAYTKPPGARIHPGDAVSWTFSIEGGKPADKLKLSADSLSPSLLSKTDLRVETLDNISRKYRLTARTILGQTGRAEIKASIQVAEKVRATTNLVFQVVPLGPPILTLPSAPPLVLESERDSLVLPFTVSDDKIDSDKLTFSATADPADRVILKVQDNGSVRTVTLSRNGHQSGPVNLSVRVAAPDGRETNQTYSVSVAQLSPPTLAVTVVSTTPPGATVHPGDEVAWNFTVEGGPSSEKPLVSAESLSPSILPQTALQLVASDETQRKYQLTARSSSSASGRAEVRISASLDGGTKDTVLAFTVVPPEGPTIEQLLRQAQMHWLKKELSEAIDCCNKALAKDAQSFKALTIKGGVLYSLTRYQEALNVCNQALKINAQYADAWFTKAASEHALQNYREAISSYEKFISLAPGDPRLRDARNRVQELQALLSGK